MRRAASLLALLAFLACKSEEKTPGIPIVATVGANPSLGAGVDVLYDGWGVPHVYAQSDADAAYATGYLHARDRLFQMDFLRRAARGRLSEWVGQAGMTADVAIRTLFTSTQHTAAGSYRIEDVIAERLQASSPELVAILQAYASGVNRYLADLAAGHNGARLPVEYGLVGVGAGEVAAWTIEDTLAIGRLFTWELSGGLEGELAYGQLALAFGGGAGPPAPIFWDLTRFAPAVGSVILPPGAGLVAAAPAAALVAPDSAQALAGARAALSGLPRLAGPEKAGSNNWVLARAHADGVHALVANDPHLSLSDPSNFHLIHLVTPTRDVAGVAFPGAPAVLIGHNGKIAWGDTVVGYDVTDVYVEAVSAGQIVVPAGAPGAVTIDEAFTVRGVPAPVHVPVVLVPNHGPVLPGSMTSTTAYTMKWTGQVPSLEVKAFWDLNAARTVTEAFAALKSFEVGAQNFVIADSAGNIGYFPHAYVPIRAATCLSPPWAPMPGDGSCDWIGRIPEPDDASCAANPLKCLPQSLNPARGWIATANNDVTGFTLDNNPLNDPAYLYAYTDLGYRHARIVERLTSQASGYALDDMTSIQSDDVSKFAQALVPGLSAWFASQDCGAESGGPSCAGALAAKGLGAAATLLAGWDFKTPTGLSTADPTSAAVTTTAVAQSSEAAALFHVLVPRLARRILDDDLAQYTVGGAPLSVDRFEGMTSDQELAKYLAALAVYAQGGVPTVPLATGQGLCDDRTTPAVETCADMAVRALEDAVAFLSQASVFGSADPAAWRWGRLHRVVFQNPVSQFGAPFFDYGPFANDGGLYTVDVGNFSWSDDGSSGLAPERGFIQHAGPNVRFAAELGDSGVRWRAVLPGGESGFPGDPHYEDQIPAWLGNEKGDQPYTRAEVDAAATGRLVLAR